MVKLEKPKFSKNRHFVNKIGNKTNKNSVFEAFYGYFLFFLLVKNRYFQFFLIF